uniref:Uncharacterized protein n=1 Tax=Anopheles melas TaxID=34690 RepID=A0A182TIQ8_9DIPT
MSSEKKLGYKTPHSPFLSKVTFHWIVPLLWRGYREPLELEDLGNLHEKDTSRYHYDQFLFIYQSYKVSLSQSGRLCSLVGRNGRIPAIGTEGKGTIVSSLR